MELNVLEGINKYPEVVNTFITILEKLPQTKLSRKEKFAAKLSLLKMAKESEDEITVLDVYKKWLDSTLLEPLAKIIKKYMLF